MKIPVEVIDDTEFHGVATDFIFDTILDTTSLYTGYQVNKYKNYIFDIGYCYQRHYHDDSTVLRVLYQKFSLLKTGSKHQKEYVVAIAPDNLKTPKVKIKLISCVFDHNSSSMLISPVFIGGKIVLEQNEVLQLDAGIQAQYQAINVSYIYLVTSFKPKLI